MRYRIIHRTLYKYGSPVTVSHHIAHLAPRSLPTQRCPWHSIAVSPEPVSRTTFADSHGNVTTYFEVEGAHETLEVVASSLVEVRAAKLPDPAQTPAWESIRDACDSPRMTAAAMAGAYRFPSPMVPVGPEFAAYAAQSFLPGRPILQALRDFTRRIFEEFRFDTRATDVATPVSEVLRTRAGVCQDFAHLALACIRSLGLPARYVSGYLETKPPPGKPKLVGADASHAWIAVYCGDIGGWIDADPTNNVLPENRHVTVAWGRDFSDVSPLRGVTLGAGEQVLKVAVDVLPVDEQ